MFKILKYNLKESFKYISIVICSELVIFLGLLSRLTIWSKESIMGINILTVFASGLAITIYIIQLYKRELYEDRRYLTFTLPLKSRDILWAKLITSILLYLIIGVVNFIVTITLINKLSFILVGMNYAEFMGLIKELIGVRLFTGIIVTFINISLFILTIFLSITLGKYIFKNKKSDFLNFIIFLVLNSAIGYITVKISEYLPIYYKVVNVMEHDMVGTINLTQSICSGVCVVIIFIITSYLLEKKIDL